MHFFVACSDAFYRTFAARGAEANDRVEYCALRSKNFPVGFDITYVLNVRCKDFYFRERERGTRILHIKVVLG